MDVMMPRLNCLSAVMRIRETKNIPIIILSAKTEESDKIIGLSMGADDYVSKPFRPDELVARVKAHLRRRNISSGSASGEYEENNLLTTGGLEIDLSAHTVTVDGNPVHLTAKEFELLVLFCKYPNRVFTSRQIFDNLWNTYGLEDDVRTVMVHISNLRKKIEINPEKPKYIQTVRGVGYKLVSYK